MFGLPIAPGFAWPVVVPGGLPWTEFDNPEALPVELDNPDALPAEEGPLDDVPAEPPAAPPAPAACASPEPASANTLTNAIVANFMGRFPCCCAGITRKARPMFPHLSMNNGM